LGADLFGFTGSGGGKSDMVRSTIDKMAFIKSRGLR
jgi:hypothetical protein